MPVKEKIAYLKGLVEGCEIDHATKEGKILYAMLDVLDEIGNELCLDQGTPESEFSFFCPNCNDTVTVTADSLVHNEDLVCPKCNEAIGIILHDL